MRFVYQIQAVSSYTIESPTMKSRGELIQMLELAPVEGSNDVVLDDVTYGEITPKFALREEN